MGRSSTSPIWHRREAVSGRPMLVRLPTKGDWRNTNEGGMAFYFIVAEREGVQRCVCIPGGGPQWRSVCCVSRPSLRRNLPVDAAMLIGSTGLSLWSDERGEYFCPKIEDLNYQGVQLFLMLERFYGAGLIHIVTLLDT